MPLISSLLLAAVFGSLLVVFISCLAKRLWKGAALVMAVAVVLLIWWSANDSVGVFEAGGSRIEILYSGHDEGFVLASVSGRGEATINFGNDIPLSTGSLSKVQAFYSPSADAIWVFVATSLDPDKPTATVFDLRAGALNEGLKKTQPPADAVELPLLR